MELGEPNLSDFGLLVTVEQYLQQLLTFFSAMCWQRRTKEPWYHHCV